MPAIGERVSIARRIYLGVDPGASGAFAALDARTNGLVTLDFSKATEKEMWEWLRANVRAFELEPYAVIERVQAFPKQGVSSSFNFGQSYGFLRGMLTASCIPFDRAEPAAWQKAVGAARRGKAEQRDHKKALRARAQQLFPHATVTANTADAILLAAYCRMRVEGKTAIAC